MKVVLIVVDTLRSDHLGCYGYWRDTSPNLDRLAQQGAVFPDFHTVGSPTGPSFSTIITGRQPIHHGFYVTPWNAPNSANFDDEIRTLPEMLWNAELGITTAAFDNLVNFASPMKQMVRGVEYYINVTRRAPGYDDRVLAETINSRLLPWLAQHAAEDFFCLVHYWDPHMPYNQPQPFMDIFHHEPGRRDDLTVVQTTAGYDYVPGWGKSDQIFEGDDEPVQVDAVTTSRRSIDLYDGEIRYVDYHIGCLLDQMEELGILDETLIIVTGDHGETLNQHLGLWGHGTLYESDLAVPMIMRWPARLSAGQSIGGYATNLDITPTVLDAFGLAGNGLDGRSLLAVIDGQTTLPDRIVAEIGGGRALIDGPWKLMQPKECTYPLLFNFADDPAEVCDLAQAEPDRAARMSNELDSWVRDAIGLEEDPSNQAPRTSWMCYLHLQ